MMTRIGWPSGHAGCAMAGGEGGGRAEQEGAAFHLDPGVFALTARADLSQAAVTNSSPGPAMPFALSDIRTRLFASVLSDCLNSVGVMDQALPARIRPLDEASVMVGRARTAQFMEVDGHEAGHQPV